MSGSARGRAGAVLQRAFAAALRRFGYGIERSDRLARWREATQKLKACETRARAVVDKLAEEDARSRAIAQQLTREQARVKALTAEIGRLQAWRAFAPVPVMTSSWSRFVAETSQSEAMARTAALTEGMDAESALVARAAMEEAYWAPWSEPLRDATRFHLPYFKTRAPADFAALGRVSEEEKALFTRKGPVNLGAVCQSLAFHHGLFEVSEAARAFLRDKDVIDAGAYVGDSAHAFCKHGPRSVHAFEPTETSYVTLSDVAANGPHPGVITPVKRLLSDRADAFAMSADQGSGNAIVTEGETAGAQETVESTTIDAYAAGHGLRLGLLKADVEGHEMQVLRGGLETLRRDRPVLLLSIYHTPEDFFGLKAFVEDELGDYAFRIRKYSATPVMETILIATPTTLG